MSFPRKRGEIKVKIEFCRETEKEMAVKETKCLSQLAEEVRRRIV